MTQPAASCLSQNPSRYPLRCWYLLIPPEPRTSLLALHEATLSAPSLSPQARSCVPPRVLVIALRRPRTRLSLRLHAPSSQHSPLSARRTLSDISRWRSIHHSDWPLSSRSARGYGDHRGRTTHPTDCTTNERVGIGTPGTTSTSACPRQLNTIIMQYKQTGSGGR